ncbi:hypothetical protein R1sor_010516 [Riccia sorocarpa]|uniref:Uncharacterized protein n=1 Tax=Riccia sorocarpa TaxID=122646 RepID=A0ABD3I261_9MARC
MTRLITEEDEELTEEDNIMEEIFTFYKDLYSKEELPNNYEIEEAISLQTLTKQDNLRNLTDTIARFEKFSEARLNITKSAVIPIAMTEAPLWLVDSGSQIIKPNEHITYLGCRAGPRLTEDDHTRDIAEKLEGDQHIGLTNSSRGQVE